MRLTRGFLPALVTVAAFATTAAAAPVDPRVSSALRWRNIGPFRGGRTVAAVGVPQTPGLFYIGVNDGGVWRSDDYGRVWTPLFDSQPTGSIGALAVAPSDPRVIYAGSGEGLQRPDLSVGDGIYRSDDAGATWQHLGLRDAQQIAQLAVDPRDPHRLFAAALGHPYGPNAERGVFRSGDGGATWEKVLGPDENTGAADVVLHPRNPDIVFADLYAARATPWEGFAAPLSSRCGLYKSTDGGTTWRHITRGLPDSTQGLGRIGVCVCPSDSARMYAIVGTRGDDEGGLFRSDDAGESWRRVNADPRLYERDGDFNEVKVDPKNADIVYVANVMTWKSTDGGAHVEPFRGAPGGDDYHRFWIAPYDSRVILLSSDQGAVVTVNGGATWSSWYNQPTAQMFHVNVDDRFPYWVYGGQQESGSAGVCSRGDDGAIGPRDWRPVGVDEYSYAVPDPLHPDWIYGSKVDRFDWRTKQVEDVGPEALRSGQYRIIRTMPLVFSRADPRRLYFGTQVVFETRDDAKTWRAISGDLTRPSPEVPPTLGVFTALDFERGTHRGVVYALAPSPRRANLLWAGTDDGKLWVTHDDGAHWRDVTPPTLTAWSKVSILEASPFDTLTAYAAINRIRCDDMHPHILRTRDGGATWQEIVTGLPDDAPVNVVRADPRTPGLLFCGTQRAVYVSCDDGDTWQSLRLNMAASSVRDLAIHESDLVAATHGRGFWILDDYAPLREAAAASAATQPHLVAPTRATRVRHNTNTDTPRPPDEPMAPNPPDGTCLDYWLPRTAAHVALEIRDSTGALVRRLASDDSLETVTSFGHVPPRWWRVPRPVETTAGAHRVVWDLRYPTPRHIGRGFPLAAVDGDTPREPRGVFVAPGRYTVTLLVDGARATRTLEVRMDPRVPITTRALAEQCRLARRVAALVDSAGDVAARIGSTQAAADSLRLAPGAPIALLDTLRAALSTLQQGAVTTRPGPRADIVENLSRLAREFDSAYRLCVETDSAPRAQLRDDIAACEAAWHRVLVRRDAVLAGPFAAADAACHAAGLPALPRP